MESPISTLTHGKKLSTNAVQGDIEKQRGPTYKNTTTATTLV